MTKLKSQSLKHWNFEFDYCLLFVNWCLDFLRYSREATLEAIQGNKPDQPCGLSAVTESIPQPASCRLSHTAIVIGGDAGEAGFKISRSVVDHIAVGGPLE